MAAAALLAAGALGAQTARLAAPAEFFKTGERALQLIESTRVAAPVLGRAAEPVAENARQAFENLRAAGPQRGPLVYAFLSNVRAYLTLADALDAPAELSDEARRQFQELRDAQERLALYFRALLERKEAQLSDPDRDALARYAEANRKVPPPQAGRQRVVFLGASITEFWRLKEYFPEERDFINRGIAGQITGQLLGRMKADVIDLKPAAVVVQASSNDLARGVAPQVTRDAFAMIGQLAEANKIVPIFSSMLPVSDYHKGVDPSYARTLTRPPAAIAEMNAWLRKFCQERKYIYVDFHSRLVDAAGYFQAELSDDGLHPNSRGYRLMAPLLLEAIDKVLAPPPQKKRRGSFLGVFTGGAPKAIARTPGAALDVNRTVGLEALQPLG
jgi:lysophospholipase L1-like esterase